MSRTYKDKPYKLRFPRNDNSVRTGIFSSRELPTVSPKLRKASDTEDHWMTTPGWWNNLYHTRPIRNKFRNYTKAVVGYPPDKLDWLTEPADSKKPHQYFY